MVVRTGAQRLAEDPGLVPDGQGGQGGTSRVSYRGETIKQYAGVSTIIRYSVIPEGALL